MNNPKIGTMLKMNCIFLSKSKTVDPLTKNGQLWQTKKTATNLGKSLDIAAKKSFPTELKKKMKEMRKKTKGLYQS